MKRYLCAWFPDWSLDRLWRQKRRRGLETGAAPDEASPFALIEPGAHGLLIVAANRSAQAGGVVAGLGLSDARARLPGLRHEEIDRAADRLALRHLADWLGRYCPLVALHGADGVMLETTGCDHLFGGEAAMAAEIAARLEAFGLGARVAMASTPGAAHALARAGMQSPAILAPGDTPAGLASLPVSALRLNGPAQTLLRRFGLHQIGQLYGLERKALARRFASRDAADDVVRRLDQALGRVHEPLAPLCAPARHLARLPCPEPLTHQAGIEAGLESLLGELCNRLVAHGCGARSFRLVAYRSDASLSQAEVHTARPVRQPHHLMALFREQIATLDPGFGIDLLVLEARRTESMDAGAPALPGDLAGHVIDVAQLAALADTITARLGPGTVRTLHAQASHLPERAEIRRVFEGQLPQDWSENAGHGPRPLRLFARPQPVEVLAEVPDGPPLRFVWRRVVRRITRADGPERIAPEWWLQGETALPTPLVVIAVNEAPSGPSRRRGGQSDKTALSATHVSEAIRGQSKTALSPTHREAKRSGRSNKTALSPDPCERSDTGASKNSPEPRPIAQAQPKRAVKQNSPERDPCERSDTGAIKNSPERDPSRSEAKRAVKRTRDYYRVEDEAGCRYWVFRDGLYDDGRGGPPQWFVHGVFA